MASAARPDQKADDLNDSWVELHYQSSPLKSAGQPVETMSSSTDPVCDIITPQLPLSCSTGSMERLLIDAQRESRTPSRPNSNQSSQGGSPKSPSSPNSEWSNDDWRSKQDPGTEWMWDWSSRPEVQQSVDSMCEKFRHPGSLGSKRHSPLSVRNTKVMSKTGVFSLANLPTLLLTHACTFFLGAAARGVLFETLQHRETINAARYCQTLDKLRGAIRRKRPGQLTNGVILHHDNATPHTARVTQGLLEKYGWEILPHPPHSPDLAPSDYHLFGPLKRELAGKRFDDNEELVDHVRKWLQNLDGSFFQEGIYSMVRRWQKCVDRLGCIVEK
ncbi:histone-lysine N-methyltransferase SETMAR [Elysia marginata]|uniref:Histone-lysine N-methyltransferase SETMAR n=1 Tax=Elysia marginata TaxID=1093978 RepID=A0AAV4IRM4_9GAST|nr:histone-lysine N-methyltransferase SETMAR [Elysia marginata]